MVSNNPNAQDQLRSHSLDEDIVPILFQPGFQLCLPVALLDAGVRPIFERRSQEGDSENDCRQCDGQDKNSVGHVVKSRWRDQSYRLLFSSSIKGRRCQGKSVLPCYSKERARIYKTVYIVKFQSVAFKRQAVLSRSDR